MRKIEIEISKGKLLSIEDSYNLPNLTIIRTVREELKISQSELSRITGIPQPSISRWELERSDPPYSKAKKLFETLQALLEKSELNNPKIKVSIPFLGIIPEQ
ncbi:MAG TPA: helix-turn-helix transcriptional regulator [Candidatus Paceibacterota bacterium]|nr:helix-turn-helix transcriptional regulator [Candidatus Paceibacterota bacterium]